MSNYIFEVGDLSIMVMQMTFNPSDVGSNPTGLISSILIIIYIYVMYLIPTKKYIRKDFNVNAPRSALRALLLAGCEARSSSSRKFK